MKHSRFLRGIAVAVAAGAGAGEQPTPPPKTTARAASRASYEKDLPNSLAREAKIPEATAAATALAKVPTGKIASVELERESGKLLYSYDIKVPGKSGIEEVQVDAMTGAIFGKVTHEGPATEKKEADDEAKEKSAAKSKTKKPPMI
jgi:hypothetical protein